MKVWKGEKYTSAAYKIDGINLTCKDGLFYTRRGHAFEFPFEGLDGASYELFAGDFNSSISVLRGTKEFDESYLYMLSPTVDARLVCDPNTTLEEAIARGYEGLVFDRLYKVKPFETYDVKVIDILPGTKKYKGKMGAVMTDMGKVGTGFTDKQRDLGDYWLGRLIEVKCLHLTKNGKFRHPRFVRERPDK